MTIIIKGQIHGGKNNMGISRIGRHYPKRNWAQWRDAAVIQVRLQMEPLCNPMIVEPCTMFVKYTPSDRRRRDATALLDAIFHVLEHAAFVKDDTLFKQIHWCETEPNKYKAGAYISISEYVANKI